MNVEKGVTGVVKGFDDISWHVYHTGSKCDVFFSRLLCSAITTELYFRVSRFPPYSIKEHRRDLPTSSPCHHDSKPHRPLPLRLRLRRRPRPLRPFGRGSRDRRRLPISLPAPQLHLRSAVRRTRWAWVGFSGYVRNTILCFFHKIHRLR